MNQQKYAAILIQYKTLKINFKRPLEYDILFTPNSTLKIFMNEIFHLVD